MLLTERLGKLDQASNIAMPAENPDFGGLPNLETITIIRELMSLKSKLSLSDVLACLRRSRATDPRDMVYGLLSLIPNKALHPDYSNATTQDVYIALVEQCITEEKSLDIITLCRRSASALSLPSWVPDWTESYERGDELHGELLDGDLPTQPLILKYGSGEHLRSFTLIDDPFPVLNVEGIPRRLTPWSADNKKDPVATVQRSSSSSVALLVARGVAVGNITSLGSFTNRDADDGDLFFFDVLSDWEEVLLKQFGLCRDMVKGKDLLDVFDRCLDILTQYLIRNGVDFADERREKLQKREAQRMHRRERYTNTDASYNWKGGVVEAFIRTILADMDEDSQRISSSKYDKIWDIDTSMSSEWNTEIFTLPYATNRRLFVANVSDGCYIGLAPIKAQVGDQVSVLFGCSVPVVLREVGDGFTFVGEAFAHGLMDGEAIRKADLGLWSEKEFVIA